MDDYIYLYHTPTPVNLPGGDVFVGSQMVSVVKSSNYDTNELVAMNIEGKLKYATKDFLETNPHYNEFVVT